MHGYTSAFGSRQKIKSFGVSFYFHLPFLGDVIIRRVARQVSEDDSILVERKENQQISFTPKTLYVKRSLKNDFGQPRELP